MQSPYVALKLKLTPPKWDISQMPDPLTVLPNEIWIICMEKVIDGQVNGPLEYMLVSTTWERLLVDAPSLWTQIYIHNGEDETARISTFLYLSQGCSLYVDIIPTAHPDMSSMQAIAENIPRVTAMSIRPGPSKSITALEMDQWKQSSSYNLAKLFNSLTPDDVDRTSCYGFNLRENGQLYYRVVLMQFTMVTRIAGNHRQNGFFAADLSHIWPYFHHWQKYIARYAFITGGCNDKRVIPGGHQSTLNISADWDTSSRTSSITSIVDLTSHGEPQLLVM